MKILYVITKGTPWGGAQKYVFDLSCATHAAGHDVAVLLGSPGDLGKKLRGVGIRTIELQGLGRDIEAKSDAATYTALATILRSEKPDVVHLNSSKVGALGVVAARMARVPRIIFTAHAWAFNEDRPWWQRFLIGVAHYFTVLLAHTTICPSQAMREDMAYLPLVSSKMIVVPHGIEEPEFKERTEARRLLIPEKTNTLWFGSIAELHPVKRIIDAIDALALLRDEIPDAVLVVMGGGEEKKKLEVHAARAGVENRVFLLGFVENAPSYLKAFDVFVLPSRSEAFGYALVEAGYAALPSIATDVGALPEIIDDKENGLLVPPNNPARLASAMRTLAKDPVLGRRVGEALRTSVSTRFSLKRMVHETLALYRS